MPEIVRFEEVRVEDQDTGLILVNEPGSSSRRPVIWGYVHGVYSRFFSREELESLLLAAGYALGLPRAEERRVLQMIRRAPLRHFRTAAEHQWRESLFPHARTESHDVAFRHVSTEVRAAIREEKVDRPDRFDFGLPICLAS